MRDAGLGRLLDEGGPPADRGTLLAILARRDRRAARRLRAATVSSTALAAALLAGGAAALATGAVVTSGSRPPVVAAAKGTFGGSRAPASFSTQRPAASPGAQARPAGTAGRPVASYPASRRPSTHRAPAGGCGGVFGTVVARLGEQAGNAPALIVAARVDPSVRQVRPALPSGEIGPLTPVGGWVVLVRTLGGSPRLATLGTRLVLRAYGASGNLLATLEVPREPYTASRPTCSR
jgi:hypothetical protein